jgi:hypothetical protein
MQIRDEQMKTHRGETARIRGLPLAALCALLVLPMAMQRSATRAAAPAAQVPDLSGAFERGLYMKPPPGIDADVILPVGGVIPGMFGPGPIRHASGTDPAKYYALGDDRSPLLKTRAATAVKLHNDAVSAGRLQPPGARPCRPSGLFMELTNPGTVRISQTASTMTMQFDSDGERRVIQLNASHPANIPPTMNGHSVGHWEGDTLVVDTVGIAEASPLDRYGTPHTGGLHVVERIRLIHGGQALENHVFAEDPATFFAPWWGVVTYRRANAVPGANACPGR